MKELSIDIETYSSKDLIKTGVYAYANAPDFQILLFAYAFDDEDVKVVDVASGEELPTAIMEALIDCNIRKTAYNANFERTCISKYYNIVSPAEQWQCTMICAAEIGLPRSLEQVAEVLGLEEQKDRTGKACIDYFSKPFLIEQGDYRILNEKTIENYLKKEVEKHGGLCLKFISASMRGLPDRIVLFSGGRILFVELKVPGKKPRAEQLRLHERLKKLGVKVYVIDSKEKVKGLIENEVCTAQISADCD